MQTRPPASDLAQDYNAIDSANSDLLLDLTAGTDNQNVLGNRQSFAHKNVGKTSDSSATAIIQEWI
jgi:hypothetical protein